MGDVVVGAGTSHAPTIPFLSQRGDREQASRFYAGLETIQEAFEKAKPDVVIVMSNDHWNTFYVDNLPAICVGLANEHFGPIEDHLGIPQRPFPGHRDLAMELVEEALDSGFGVSSSEGLVLDHGIGIPLHFITPAMDVPVIPILVNNLLDPRPPAKVLYQLGALIQRVVSSRPSGERVALLGTGGLSHSPGESVPGLNVEFDEWFLDEVEAGRGQRLADMSRHEIARGGTAADELKNWITVMGAMPDVQGEILTYEPIGDIGHGAVLWPA